MDRSEAISLSSEGEDGRAVEERKASSFNGRSFGRRKGGEAKVPTTEKGEEGASGYASFVKRGRKGRTRVGPTSERKGCANGGGSRQGSRTHPFSARGAKREDARSR